MFQVVRPSIRPSFVNLMKLVNVITPECMKEILSN